MNEPLKIRRVDWQSEQSVLRQIRTEVFIEEQQVPEQLEWDGHDVHCLHLLAVLAGRPIGTARLLACGQIGRLAVLPEHRHQGVGTTLMRTLLTIAAERSLNTVFLNAQVEAMAFYRQFGFEQQGDLFTDAGILHRRMQKSMR